VVGVENKDQLERPHRVRVGFVVAEGIENIMWREVRAVIEMGLGVDDGCPMEAL